jgi:hypothetical protein
MKRLALAVGFAAVGFAATIPARADYAVVKFEGGYCRIWWDSSATPAGPSWTKIAIAPDFASAWDELEKAIATNTCR